MTRDSKRARMTASFMWIGTALFFVISESLIVLSFHGRLKGLSPLSLWSMPFMVSVPLIAGSGFAKQLSKNSKGDEDRALQVMSSLSIPTVEFFFYAILSGVIGIYQRSR